MVTTIIIIGVVLLGTISFMIKYEHDHQIPPPEHIILETTCLYDTAVLAKEKGFDTPCMAYYTDKQKLKWNSPNWPLRSQCDIRDENILAPHQYILQRWLREVHNIHICIGFDCTNYFGHVNTFKANGLIDECTSTSPTFKEGCWSYEIALEWLLREGIKMIKNDSRTKEDEVN